MLRVLEVMAWFYAHQNPLFQLMDDDYAQRNEIQPGYKQSTDLDNEDEPDEEEEVTIVIHTFYLLVFHNNFCSLKVVLMIML